MDEKVVRDRAEGHCAALLAGDIDRAIEDYSEQLRANLGQLISQFPLPLTAATVESIEATASGYAAVLRLVGDSETVLMQTRWKDRDGQPTIVEASHVVEASAQPAEPDAEAEAEAE